MSICQTGVGTNHKMEAGMLGVLGAMDVEVQAIQDALRTPDTSTVLGQRVVRGRLVDARGDLTGVPLLVARSGVGKVNAALAVVALVRAGADTIVFTGMAGGVGDDVHIGDAVVATSLVQHDVDVPPHHEPGRLPGEPLFWAPDPVLADTLARAARTTGATVHYGRIASGDQFIADPRRAAAIAERFDALAVEMEGAAAAQAAARLGVPIAVLRWISDTADDASVGDFDAFCERIGALDLAIVRELAPAASRR
jgi:adenosylhomocysteine nucleosidase